MKVDGKWKVTIDKENANKEGAKAPVLIWKLLILWQPLLMNQLFLLIQQKQQNNLTNPNIKKSIA
ncbi:hypothetical protein H9W95_00145 [Flavobacterium lindanitolerans]|nr:hypothetical protein [Flavobacterium lindanitolerans]